MGNFSFSGRAKLGAMLGRQGAFDTNTDEDYSAAPGYGGIDNNWKDFCEDGNEYDVDPDEYGLEEEYDEIEENTGITLSFSVNSPALDKLNAIKREDYPNERRYQAAYILAKEFHVYSDDEHEKKRNESEHGSDRQIL